MTSEHSNSTRSGVNYCNKKFSKLGNLKFPGFEVSSPLNLEGYLNIV